VGVSVVSFWLCWRRSGSRLSSRRCRGREEPKPSFSFGASGMDPVCVRVTGDMISRCKWFLANENRKYPRETDLKDTLESGEFTMSGKRVSRPMNNVKVTSSCQARRYDIES
jgi:hypothetical protein